MTASPASAVKRFCNHSRRLQTILEDTKRCFDDINERATSENGMPTFCHLPTDPLLVTYRSVSGT